MRFLARSTLKVTVAIAAAWLSLGFASPLDGQDRWLFPETTADNPAEEAPPETPSLADVVYRAGIVRQRLFILKNSDPALYDDTPFAERLQSASKTADLLNARLGQMGVEDIDLHGYQMLVELMGEARRAAADVTQAVRSLKSTIQRAESERREWAEENERWQFWRSQLNEALTLSGIDRAFSQSQQQIDEAHRIITLNLEPLLSTQFKAGEVSAKISKTIDHVDALMALARTESLRGGTAAMFSRAYPQH